MGNLIRADTICGHEKEEIDRSVPKVNLTVSSGCNSDMAALEPMIISPKRSVDGRAASPANGFFK
jgi:hypothetical protein